MNHKHEYSMVTPEHVGKDLAGRVRQLRLMRRWKQVTLAERAGVSLPSLRRFEQTGQISLKSLLRLSFTLGRLPDFEGLLQPPPGDSIAALEAMATTRHRKRGSQ